MPRVAASKRAMSRLDTPSLNRFVEPSVWCLMRDGRTGSRVSRMPELRVDAAATPCCGDDGAEKAAPAGPEVEPEFAPPRPMGGYVDEADDVHKKCACFAGYDARVICVYNLAR